MEWYDDFFSTDPWQHLQEHLYPPERSAEQARQIAALLGLEAGDRVLDVPCGTGRIALELARAGLDVTGVDFNPASLARARARADAEGLPLSLHQGDMRQLPWKYHFTAAVNFWGSFGYFDDVGNADFADAVCHTLRPGGRLLIDTPTVEGLMPRWQPRAWMEVDGMLVLEERSMDPLTGVHTADWTFIRDGEQTRRQTRIRVYSIPELVSILEAAGFSEVAVYGGLDGGPFQIGARNIIVATR
jgi:SAM-dependent methyltransferase